MISARREVIVGIAFVAVMVLLSVYSIAIADLPMGKKTVVVKFDKVYGLERGNTVRAYGVDVGKVAELQVNDDGGATAWLNVNDKLQIYDDYSVTVKPFSALGGRFVDIDPGTKGDYQGKDPAQNPRSIWHEDPDKGKSEAKALEGDELPEILEEISLLIERNADSITNTISNLETVTRTLTTTEGTAGKFINDPELYDNANILVLELQGAAKNLNRMMSDEGELGRFMNDAQVYNDLRETISYARSTMKNVSDITEKINAGEGAAGALVSDPETAENVKAMIADARTAMSNVADITGKINAGEGVAGRLINDEQMGRDIAATTSNLAKITDSMANGKGPIGVLLTDEQAGQQIRNTIANIESVSNAVASGQGTVGALLMDEEMAGQVRDTVSQIQRTVVELRESIEDAREQAPVNAFVGAIFAAF